MTMLDVEAEADAFEIPIIIRGEVIEGAELSFAARFGAGVRYATPDVERHVGRLMMSDPAGMADVDALPLGEIIAYLDALSKRLDLSSNHHLQRAFDLALRASPLTESILRHSYQHLPTLFREDVVRETLESSIGTEYLEGWVSTELANGTELAVRAFGARTVHVIAGTGPVVAAMTVMRNAVTRSDAVIKLPSNDPATAVAILQTMIDLDPGHPLTRHVSAAYWRGGSEAIEERIYDPRFIEKIVAWGGSGSMKHITRYLQPGIELVGFDPKWSATIIGRETFDDDALTAEAALRLATDIGAYNQVGCANARVIYIETGSDAEGIARANRFGQLVHDKLQTLPSSLSTPVKQFGIELKNEIDALALDRGSFKVIGSPVDGIIIVSQYDEPVEFTAIIGDRVANLVPVDSVEDALRAVTYYTQTVGVFPDSLKRALRDRAPLYGAQRLVSLGYACAPPLAGPWDAIEPIRRMCRWIIDQTSDPARTPPQWQQGVHGGFGA
jgi:hypothetical protein